MLFAGGLAAQEPQAERAGKLDEVLIEASELRPDENPFAEPNNPFLPERSSSPRLPNLLIDTPKSISILPAQAIEDAGATTLREAIENEPGITLGTGEGGSAYGDRFIIRSFEARNDVFVDGLRDPGVVTRETFSIEQVEISKGPSSSFAGRGTTGGAINSVSKLPAPDDFTKFSLAVGSPGTQRLTADVNKRLTDAWTIRLNALGHRQEVAGRDAVQDDREGLALSARWDATNKASWIFDTYLLNTSGVPDFGHPWDPVANEPYTVDRNNFYGLTDRDNVSTRTRISTLKLELDLPSRTRLISQLRVGKTQNYYVAGRPVCSIGPPLGNLCEANDQVISGARTRDQKNEFVGHLTNLIVKKRIGKTRHTFITGYELTRERFRNRPPLVINSDGSDPLVDLNNPNSAQIFDGQVVAGQTLNTSDVDSQAVWISDDVKLNPDWQVSTGLRWDRYSITGRSVQDDGQVTRDGALKQSYVNWHLGVVYRPIAGMRLYGTISSSSNPPGEQVDSVSPEYGGLDENTAALKAERNRGLEAGVKWRWPGRKLNSTFAFFQTTKDDPIVPGSAGALPTQFGQARVRGIEFSTNGKSGNLDIRAGFSLQKTEITAAMNPADVGSRLPNAAHQSANFQTRYTLTNSLVLGATVTYTGEVYGGVANRAANNTRLPSWTRLDLMVTYRVSKDWSVRLNVQNVADRTYYNAIYLSDAPFAYVAPGRSALLTLRYGF